jgi:hypothetical protein
VPAQFVEALAKAERLFAVAAIGNDWLGSSRVQLLAQFAAVVSLVAEHSFGWLGAADKPFGDWTVVGFTSGQQNSNQAPLSICECVNLRIPPSARAANSLFLLPPFPPAAERWAFTCVESIICVSAERPLPASSRNKFSQMSRRAQRAKRL